MFAVETSLFRVKNWISNSCLYDHYVPWLVFRISIFHAPFFFLFFHSNHAIINASGNLISKTVSTNSMNAVRCRSFFFFISKFGSSFSLLLFDATVKKNSICNKRCDSMYALQYVVWDALNIVSIHIFQGIFSGMNTIKWK